MPKLAEVLTNAAKTCCERHAIPAASTELAAAFRKFGRRVRSLDGSRPLASRDGLKVQVPHAIVGRLHAPWIRPPSMVFHFLSGPNKRPAGYVCNAQQALSQTGIMTNKNAASAFSVGDFCRGKWLLMRGDSSLRGVWLALYQQLVPGTTSGVMDLRPWNGIVETADFLGVRPGGQTYSAWGWIDVILRVDGVGEWQVVAANFGAKTAGNSTDSGFERGRPSLDRSKLLTPLWCNVSARSHIRLSWAALTRSRFTLDALAEQAEAWRSSPCQHHLHRKTHSSAKAGPDAVLLTAGAWDIASQTTTKESEENMIRALTFLRDDARANGRMLGYLSATNTGSNSPLFQAWDNLTWQHAFVRQANRDGDAPRIAFIERHTPNGMLSSLSPACSGLLGPAQKRTGHPWHPPHAENVALLPSLLEIWLGGDPSCTYNPVVTCAVMASVLATQGPRQCCADALTPAQLNGMGADEGTAYWARQCRLTARLPTQCHRRGEQLQDIRPISSHNRLHSAPPPPPPPPPTLGHARPQWWLPECRWWWRWWCTPPTPPAPGGTSRFNAAIHHLEGGEWTTTAVHVKYARVQHLRNLLVGATPPFGQAKGDEREGCGVGGCARRDARAAAPTRRRACGGTEGRHGGARACGHFDHGRPASGLCAPHPHATQPSSEAHRVQQDGVCGIEQRCHRRGWQRVARRAVHCTHAQLCELCGVCARAP